MRRQNILIATLVALMAFAASVAAAPHIEKIVPAKVRGGETVTVSGSGFGSEPTSSEVIASYGNGFFYALQTERWSDHVIKVKIPDLGKSLKPALYVHTEKGVSRKKSLRLIPNLITQNSQNHIHQLKVGDKGEDVFRLRSSKASCGKKAEMFLEANVKVSKRRFSDAQIVSSPKSKCRTCKPVKVRWFNEPTGHIQYHIEVKKRLTEGVCRDRIRKTQ